MIATVSPGGIRGLVNAIPSKSQLHRRLIFAALADKPTTLRCGHTEAEDIIATIGCLTALGAQIEKTGSGFNIVPANRANLPDESSMPCHESGSTLRFMLPIVCALGVCAQFHMAGRLPQRPLNPLDEELSRNGIRFWRESDEILCCKGQLDGGQYSIPGDITSQYVTGLLMALPLLDTKSTITVKKPIESADYISMTLEAGAAYGLNPRIEEDEEYVRYIINPEIGFTSPGVDIAEGDWSNAAFWLCAGAMPGGSIQMSGLKKDSSQGDRKICAILEQMGANVSWHDGILSVSCSERREIVIDARDTPDLIPVLSAVAAVGKGTTIIKNAARLRLKESDRLASTAQTLNALGAQITEQADGLTIRGVPNLKGGTVDAWGDHRIAMAVAIASCACDESVIITGAQSTNKSYPSFWEELAGLGKIVEILK